MYVHMRMDSWDVRVRLPGGVSSRLPLVGGSFSLLPTVRPAVHIGIPSFLLRCGMRTYLLIHYNMIMTMIEK